MNGRRIIRGWSISPSPRDEQGVISECLKPHVYGDVSEPRVVTGVQITFQTNDDEQPLPNQT